MLIFPAIDLYEKKAVRLYKGDYEQMTVYSENPVEVARKFRALGAEWIHIVDLEGAKTGETPNFDIICDIVRSVGLSVEVGGGIRSLSVCDRYIKAGVSRVILGTAALCDKEFLLRAVEEYGDKIAVGVDIKDGFVAVRGWTEKSEVKAFEMLSEMEKVGVKTIICTDISRDGAMNGTNTSLYREIRDRFNMNIIASGGVTDMSDIEKLSSLSLYGAIVGKAYYTGAIDLSEAIEVAR